MTELEISTDKSRLDTDMIYKFLSDSYWAKDRPKEIVDTSIENSLCFGAYLDGQQVGFAQGGYGQGSVWLRCQCICA
jgi:hypothetical protein